MCDAYYLILYTAFVNLAAFLVFGIDKLLARNRRRRVSEATLLALAVVGGSLGAWAGMYMFRHKTLHAKFRFGIPIIMICQVVLLALCF